MQIISDREKKFASAETRYDMMRDAQRFVDLYPHYAQICSVIIVQRAIWYVHFLPLQCHCISLTVLCRVSRQLVDFTPYFSGSV